MEKRLKKSPTIIEYKITKRSILAHSLFWSFFIGLGLTGNFFTRTEDYRLAEDLINSFAIILFFYLCTYLVLVPISNRKQKYALPSVIALIVIFVLLKFLHEYLAETDYYKDMILEQNRLHSYLLLEIWRYSLFSLFSYAYWYYLKSINEEKAKRLAEEDLLKAEINLIKTKFNPGFSFDTLNYLYNRVSPKSPKSGEAIMALTRMMRYSVESSKAELTTLAKELEAVQEYLDLQRLRFGEKQALNYTKTGSFGFMAFPPLVLVSLIENAFKYGVHDDPQNPISIQIETNDQGLHFTCKNKKRMDFSDKETTSVGITNVKRRLEMAYEDHYSMDINDTPENYEVHLEIQWKS